MEEISLLSYVFMAHLYLSAPQDHQCVVYSFNHFLIWNWSHDRLQRIHKAMRSMPWSNISQTFFLHQLPSFSIHCMILIGRVQILSVGIHSVCERVSQLPSLMASGSMYLIMMHPHSLLNLQKEIHGWLDSIFWVVRPTPICIWTLLRAVGCFFSSPEIGDSVLVQNTPL